MKFSSSYYFILVYAYIVVMPSATWFGGQKSGILFLVAILLMLLMFKSFNRSGISKRLGFLIYMFFLPLVISVGVNFEFLIAADIYEFLRILIYLLVAIFGYQYGGKISYNQILFASKIIIIFEFFFVLMQRMEVSFVLSIFQFIWNNEKNWLYRNTGSFTNPNMLGFFMILMAIVVGVSEEKKVKKNIVFLVVFVIIFLTGSRTSLMVYMIIIPFSLIDDRHFFKNLSKVLFVLAGLSVMFYWVVEFYGEENKYMYELLSILYSGDINSVATFSYRLELWQNIISKINDSNFFWGMGPGKGIGLKYVDNEYIALFSKYGIFGFLFNFSIYIILMRYVNKDNVNFCKKDKDIYFFARFMNIYFFVMLIFGITAETFTSWLYVLLFFAFLGVLVRKKVEFFYEKNLCGLTST